MNEQKDVNIPKGTDLNNGLPPQPPKDNIPEFQPMPGGIFEDLPPLLRGACDKLGDQKEKEVFLVGALGVISSILPNIEGIYFGRKVNANLYCYILGKYGTGKGALMWAKDLGEAIDSYREQLAGKEQTAYTEEMANYNRQMRLYDKGKLPTPPEQPKSPKHLKLFLPANSSKTAIMQLLKENDGRGVIFETEGDTLADMLKQDYGNFSDVLRKAFHHEPISYFRRANNEDVKITYPCLSVVLSGTADQLRRLIPSAENGLFSRFCFYILQGNAPFKNPFDSNTADHEYYYNVLSDKMLRIYKELTDRQEPLFFVLQPHQQQKFVKIFANQKEEVSEQVSDDLDGSINRLGLITYRIAMILTAMRFYTNIGKHDNLTCTDMDFNNAVAITKHLLHYNLYIYEQLLYKKEPDVDPDANKQQLIEECCKDYKMGMSVREIALHVLGDKRKKSTIFRWIQNFCKDDAA